MLLLHILIVMLLLHILTMSMFLMFHCIENAHKKIKHLKSTFGCLSESVLNQDDDNKVVNHLLDINDNANSFLPQPLDDDDDNIVTIAEEDEVYDRYGFWKERPRDPLGYRVPKPPTLSGQTCHVPTPPRELGSVEGACMDLRLGYARYLNTRVQGVTRPLTPLVDRWDALTAHPLAQGVVRHGPKSPSSPWAHRRSMAS